jgi:signal transduction histidine kinase/ActR/RegA family two-component response regulator
MAWSPLASPIPILPPPGRRPTDLVPREETALARLLVELHADHPAEPGPGHVSHRARFSEVLAALGHLAIGGDPIEPMLANACDLVAETLAVDAAALLECTASGDWLVVRTASGLLAGAAGEPVPCRPAPHPGLALGDLFLARHGLAAPALALVPGPAGPLGLLGAFEAGLRAFAPDEVRFLEAAGACLAAAIALHRSEQDRQRLYARLAVADRMISVGSLAGGVAHELNNPLSYVTANLAFITEEVGELTRRLAATGATDGALEEVASQLHAAAADARDGVEKMHGLVRDLQRLSRDDDGALAPLDLTHVLESAISVARSEIKHRARVERQLAPSLPPVRASEARLGQVFLNLLVNAAHATPEGRAADQLIRVRSFVAPGQRVAVEVSDTGCGIPADRLERIFEPFYSTRAPGGGAGLGLSICRSIVGALGGTIEVESQVGVGSTFRVLLPVAPLEPVEEQAAAARRPEAAPRRPRLLVVDDEALVGAVMERTLGRDYDLVTLTSSREALALVQAGARYDLIFSDLLMPGLTGMGLHEALEQIDPAQAARMVFLSGGACTPAALEFLARPGMECLEKPFELAVIRDAIARRLKSA